MASQDKAAPVKKEELESVSEEKGKGQDEAMEIESEAADNKQQQQRRQGRLVGPARPVQPAPVGVHAPSSEVHTKFVTHYTRILFFLLHQIFKHTCEDYGQECL